MFRYAKVILVSVGAIVALGSNAQAQVIYGHENTNLTRANQAMLAGELEVASRYFGKAIKANLGHEKLVPALNNYCAVEYALGNFENAEKVCSEAISEDRRYWRAYVNRGNARAAIGKVEQAKADYERAVKIKPGSKIANNALASIQGSKGILLAKAN